MLAVLDPVKHMLQPVKAVGISFAMFRPHNKKKPTYTPSSRFLLSNFIFVTEKKEATQFTPCSC